MMAAMKAARFPLIVISVVLMTCGCDVLNPNRQLITQDRTILLISVSPEVDHLLSVERIQEAEASRRLPEGTKEESLRRFRKLLKDPERYYPGHGSFLSAMAQQPSAAIPPKSYLRPLDDSKAKCSDPTYTTNFIKVRVTSGSLQGRVGRVCEDFVYRTVAMP
jgi:hypothetical protein